MTYLVITDNLIDNLDDLEINELKYEKIKSDEISNSTSVSLFSDDSYKFVPSILTNKLNLVSDINLAINNYSDFGSQNLITFNSMNLNRMNLTNFYIDLIH